MQVFSMRICLQSVYACAILYVNQERKGVHMATDTKMMRVDSETHALLKKLAAQSGRTMMGQIRHLVVENAYREHIKRQGMR